MRSNSLIPLLLTTLAAMPAVAASPKLPSMTCNFETECTDSDCADSSYSATVQMKAARPVDSHLTMMSAVFSDPSESYEMQGMIVDGNRRMFNMDSETGARLLTVAADGSARYTNHIAEPLMAMTYLGQCEEDR